MLRGVGCGEEEGNIYIYRNHQIQRKSLPMVPRVIRITIHGMNFSGKLFENDVPPVDNVFLAIIRRDFGRSRVALAALEAFGPRTEICATKITART